MKYYVNENCIECGLCESVCPDVFSLSDEGVAVAISEDALESAAEAMNDCPVGAISTE